MGRRGSSGAGSEPGGASQVHQDTELVCDKCLRSYSNKGNLNKHRDKCQAKPRRGEKRANRHIYEQYKLTRNDKLAKLIMQIPCRFLQYQISQATETYVPNCYPLVFNIGDDMSPKRGKLDHMCLLLADAISGHEADGVLIPKHFGKSSFFKDLSFTQVYSTFGQLKH